MRQLDSGRGLRIRRGFCAEQPFLDLQQRGRERGRLFGRRGGIEFRIMLQFEVADDLDGQLRRLQDGDLGLDGSRILQGSGPAALVLGKRIADHDEGMGDIVDRQPHDDGSGAGDSQNGNGNEKELPAP